MPDDTAGAPEQPLKVLEGWGGTVLPDPPAMLRQVADETKTIADEHNDAAWSPRHPPPLGVPKYATFLGIEYQFLLKDKNVSQGMLALHHGHTFRVQGVEEPVVTFTLSAGVHPSRS